MLWGGGLALAALALWKREAIADVVSMSARSVYDVIKRGAKLTEAPAGTNGLVPIDPELLRKRASAVMGFDVLLDVYSAARMLRSEGAAAGEIRVHVAMNDAAALGWSLHQVITYSSNAEARGLYGEQFTPAARAPGGVASKRRYASPRDPYAGDVEVAMQAMVDHRSGLDPTEGATKFVDKSSMGVQEGSGSYADLVARWGADGLRPFTLPGYGPDLVVFRRVV